MEGNPTRYKELGYFIERGRLFPEELVNSNSQERFLYEHLFEEIKTVDLLPV